MREIPLTRGLVAIIDKEDFEWVSQYSWNAHFSRGNFYAVRGVNIGRVNGKKKIVTFKMHREIIGARHGEIVDHINRNPLDNRRINLRIATVRENKINERTRTDNTSGFRGVFFEKHCNKFRARIVSFGRKFNGGLFETAEAAAKEYDNLAMIHHGAFARLNFPNEHKKEIEE